MFPDVGFFRTYSPQGDGNKAAATSSFQTTSTAFFRTYSPQGDGNTQVSLLGKLILVGSFSEPIPRKGTETLPGYLS